MLKFKAKITKIEPVEDVPGFRITLETIGQPDRFASDELLSMVGVGYRVTGEQKLALFFRQTVKTVEVTIAEVNDAGSSHGASP